MKQSISYYITKAVIRLKGIKKDFSRDPIDYKRIRRDDVHAPNKHFFKQSIVRQIKLKDSLVTIIEKEQKANTLLIFVHGGAFIAGPAQHHWDTLREIVKQTNCSVWMCDYPKAPETKIQEISRNIDAIYHYALKTHPSDQIILMGDSAGGTLVTALTQRLIQAKTKLPKKVILISPVMDATMTNAAIEDIDAVDPMLSKAGVLSAKKMCAGADNLQNEMISPINGSFLGFPSVVMFVAEHDITFPDQQLAIEKMKKAAIDLKVIQGANMPHIWPLLPVMKEAKDALKLIIQNIK